MFCLLLPCFSGCIRTAIPEYYSGLQSGGTPSPGNSQRALRRVQASPTIIFVRKDLVPEPDLTIGHQYLLFFLPFTSLYFPEGAQREMEELAMEVLTEKGNLVLTLNEKDAAELPLGPDTPSVYRIDLQSPRLNAFDVFFFRILDMSGQISVSISRPNELPEEITVPIDSTSYRKFALGPRLSYQFHKALRDSFSKVLQGIEEKQLYLGPRRSLRARLKSEEVNSSTQKIFLMRPRLAAALPVSLGQTVANSFGYPNSLAYSDESMLRMMQEGLWKGLPDNLRGIQASSSDPQALLGYLETAGAVKNPWVLESSVAIPLSDAELAKSLKNLPFRLDLELSEHTPSGTTALSSLHCEGSLPIPWDREGSLVVALHEAFALVARQLFVGDPQFQEDTEAATLRCTPPAGVQ